MITNYDFKFQGKVIWLELRALGFSILALLVSIVQNWFLILSLLLDLHTTVVVAPVALAGAIVIVGRAVLRFILDLNLAPVVAAPVALGPVAVSVPVSARSLPGSGTAAALLVPGTRTLAVSVPGTASAAALAVPVPGTRSGTAPPPLPGS